MSTLSLATAHDVITINELQDLEAGTILHDPDGDRMLVAYDNDNQRNTVVHLTSVNARKRGQQAAIIWGGDISAFFPATIADEAIKVVNV